MITLIKSFFIPIGVRMSEYFWKLPSKRLYPDYYKMIKNPISLLQIRTKIKVINKNINCFTVWKIICT